MLKQNGIRGKKKTNNWPALVMIIPFSTEFTIFITH